MPDTLEGAFLLALLILPGFLLVGISRVGRPPGPSEGDLVITLRSFAIALAIQVPIFPLWTRQLADDTNGNFDGLLNHSVAASVYAGTILLLLPIVLGLGLRAQLSRAEQKVQLSQLDRLLGARLPDTAWDVLLRSLQPGDLLIVNLNDKRTVVGSWGAGSYASRGDSPEPSLYLSSLWTVDAAGLPVAQLGAPWSGVWIQRSQVVSMTRYCP